VCTCPPAKTGQAADMRVLRGKSQNYKGFAAPRAPLAPLRARRALACPWRLGGGEKSEQVERLPALAVEAKAVATPFVEALAKQLGRYWPCPCHAAAEVRVVYRVRRAISCTRDITCAALKGVNAHPATRGRCPSPPKAAAGSV